MIGPPRRRWMAVIAVVLVALLTGCADAKERPGSDGASTATPAPTTATTERPLPRELAYYKDRDLKRVDRLEGTYWYDPLGRVYVIAPDCDAYLTYVIAVESGDADVDDFFPEAPMPEARELRCRPPGAVWEEE